MNYELVITTLQLCYRESRRNYPTSGHQMTNHTRVFNQYSPFMTGPPAVELDRVSLISTCIKFKPLIIAQKSSSGTDSVGRAPPSHVHVYLMTKYGGPLCGPAFRLRGNHFPLIEMTHGSTIESGLSRTTLNVFHGSPRTPRSYTYIIKSLFSSHGPNYFDAVRWRRWPYTARLNPGQI